MKLIMAFMFFAATFPVLGQHVTAETELARQATEFSRAMSRQLQLNEQEYIQVKKLTLEKMRAINEIQENYAYHPVLLNHKLQEVENRYQRQLTSSLNAVQVEHYLAAKPGAAFASGVR